MGILFLKSSLFFLLTLIILALPGYCITQRFPDPLSVSHVVDRYAEDIFRYTAATGLVVLTIDGDHAFFNSFGETEPGNGLHPKKDSLIRIASLSKLMTSQLMITLSEEGYLRLNDPLSRYAPSGIRIPSYEGQRITLMNLATHTSGLPRERPGGNPMRPVFVWPTRYNRWNWLKTARLNARPGTRAIYSNLAYDLLADALERAVGIPYPKLLINKITDPLGMKDTTFTPSLEQCSRLMVPQKGANPCNITLAAIGSGGLYSTPGDMGRWMQQFLSSDRHQRSLYASRLQTLVYRRDQLLKIEGMDIPGQADAIGMGWVFMQPKHGLPGIIQKTGGGGGFITYLAMVPQHNIGVFVVATRSPSTRFTAMSDEANRLLAALVNNKKNGHNQ